MPGDRISIFANGRETILADYEDSVQEGADVAPENDLQVVKFLRGSKIKVFDRSNGSIQLSLVINQEWDDDVKAFDFFVNCRNQVPRLGNLTWRCKNGTSLLSRYVVGAGVKVKPVRRMGSATWIQYTIIGPEITTTPPSTGA